VEHKLDTEFHYSDKYVHYKNTPNIQAYNRNYGTLELGLHPLPGPTGHSTTLNKKDKEIIS
jgi:hypothetical protein